MYPNDRLTSKLNFRKYLTLYVVLTSILVFSLKDSLRLVHKVLHAIPNSFHHHSYLPHSHQEGGQQHAGHSSHTHQAQAPLKHPAGHLHDLNDHLGLGNKKDQTDPSNKTDLKTTHPLTWDIQDLFAFQMVKLGLLVGGYVFFIPVTTRVADDHPPFPPPKHS